MQDTGSFALGGIGLAILAYAGVMAFIAGPEIGRRTIEAQNWPQICKRTIIRQSQPETPSGSNLPRINLCRTFFGLYGQQGQDYCDVHENFWNGPFDQVLNLAEQKKRAAHKWRMDRATEDSTEKCQCAQSLTLERKRLDFALYAGSARIITPPSIQNLQSELKSALSSPRCMMKG